MCSPLIIQVNYGKEHNYSAWKDEIFLIVFFSLFRGLPQAVNPLGPLISQNVFQVTSDNGKGQSQILFKNKGQRRQVFLYENHLVFTKVVNEKAGLYQFKMAMATNSLGMSGVVRGDDKKIELWVHGRNDLYSLEAIKGRQAKEDFAAELRKVIIRQKDQLQKQQGNNFEKIFMC